MKCLFACVLLFLGFAVGQRTWTSTDELENHISPDDLQEFINFYKSSNATTTEASADPASLLGETTQGPSTTEVPGYVDCFGLGTLTKQLPWLFNMQPQSSEKINTHFFFMSRKQPMRVQVLRGPQFGLEWVDFNASRKTVMIIHGFMSHSNATWVRNMTKALLEWNDVNVISVDWSRGGNTWKYWRAVANTRRVGSDVAGFLRQVMNATGAKMKDFHLIGHSLGAHICSYASYQIGGVHRITGLDPAQPCFRTTDRTERLDDSDADFVDVIHTNGRLLKKVGFGLPEPTGDADFYPNGGMKQPGCHKKAKSLWTSLLPSLLSISKLEQAICSHGRAYLLFTESIVNKNCTFRAHRWNLTYEGWMANPFSCDPTRKPTEMTNEDFENLLEISEDNTLKLNYQQGSQEEFWMQVVNASLEAACDRVASCSEMGLRADGGGGLPQARGAYFALTSEREPYCPSEDERRHPLPHLLKDLQQGFLIDPSQKPTSTIPSETTTEVPTTTTKASWLARLFG